MPRLRARRGISLLEIMVSMVLLGAVTSSLVLLSAKVATRARGEDVVNQRTARLQQAMNQFGVMPFSDLSSHTGNTTITENGFSYTRKVELLNTQTYYTTVKVVITPTAYPTRKDSIMFTRHKPRTSSPLFTQ